MADDVQIKVAMNPTGAKIQGMFSSIDVKGAAQDEINSILLIIQGFAKQLTPVKTGLLRGSIFVAPLSDEIGGMVSTNTDYAIYVDQGTRYMRARPFMEMGLGLAQPNMEGQIGSRLDKEITDKFKAL